jgi:hypothetical protein
MTSSNIFETPMIKLLLEAGFDTGWVVSDEVLVIWEHDEEPPLPLVRPEPIELIKE